MTRRVDITGNRFGHLVVESLSHSRRVRRWTENFWICRCDCGETRTIEGRPLRRGQTSCGCLNGVPRTPLAQSGRLRDLTGHRSGRLTVERFDRTVWESTWKQPRTSVYWICRCDCGNTTSIERRNILDGRHKSCGCIGRERTENAKPRRKGVQAPRKRRSPEVGYTYKSWRHAIYRCHYPTATRYPLYGAKGIIVCDRWRNSFAAFVEDMGFRPEGTSLDRIDPYGNYEPGNCRWASRSMQNSNKRVGPGAVTINGEEMSVREACRRFSLPYGQVCYYRSRHGLSPQESVDRYLQPQ